MNAQNRAIRALLTTMAPNRAISFVKAFNLPEDEENMILDRDVRGLSYTQIARERNVSPEFIKNARRRAFSKMNDEISHR